MRKLRHGNVVRMFGVAVYEHPMMIVMELCTGGSLLHQLRARQTSPEEKYRWGFEAAKGLDYINSMGYVHRDIAARNCLLTESTTLKIADFGLTLKTKQIQMESLGKVPVKWLAKETLELGIYNAQTDVWSYGVLCWEIYSNGKEPYPGMSNMQARAHILLHGYRMPIPVGTPRKIAQLITSCWSGNPSERPHFKEIKSQSNTLRTANIVRMIQRADVNELLVKNGDYLLRKTNAGESRLALSVKWADQIRHFVVLEQDKDVFFEEQGHHELEVDALVRWHRKKKMPLTQTSGAIIKRAIAREEWVLTHESVTLGEQIGAGQFGEVFKAKFKTTRGAKLVVAVKTLRDSEAVTNQKSFLSEARLMRKLRHVNVVRMFGVAVYEHPMMIVMELCTGGSLLHQLRARQTSLEEKYRWGFEAAKGLDYINSMGYVHRDIAARNCLLTESTTLKIADFGLTLKTKQVQMESLGKVPVKWLAKETLELGIYNAHTDVWSYGVLCWEIYSNGKEPYPGMSNMQARAHILLHGYRMPIPVGTPRKIAQLITNCWKGNPSERPHFKEIVEMLQ
uniref:Tyrosine-protein kinase n=1 Tax=Meloidogyne incognita TaxID=6306 RepID=A0A914MM59_MELIC